VAVAVVAQAVWGMAKSLCPDRLRAGFAILAALLALRVPSAAGQIAALLACGFAGRMLLGGSGEEATAPIASGVSPKAGVAALAVFLVLLLALPLLAAFWGESANASQATDLALLWAPIEGFYRAGALVFGGGHVVLPLLQAVVVPDGLVSNAAFLAGYGAAQAVPGPLFSFAAYLGAVMDGPLRGWTGGLFFLVVIFLPAFLLVVGALPFWDLLRGNRAVRSTMAGVSAGVVGLLLSALYDPVFVTAIRGSSDLGLALAAFGLLAFARVSPVVVVALGAAAGWVLG